MGDGGGGLHCFVCPLLVIIWLGCQRYLVLRKTDINPLHGYSASGLPIWDVVACTVVFFVTQMLHRCCRLCLLTWRFVTATCFYADVA